MKKTVYVFFKSADVIPWYMRALDPDFTHCFSYEHHLLGGYDAFLKVENLFHVLETQIFFGSKEDFLNLFEGLCCVKITKDVNPEEKTREFMPINCVSLIKKQLGITKSFILTPKQLHKHLLAIGGKEI